MRKYGIHRKKTAKLNELKERKKMKTNRCDWYASVFFNAVHSPNVTKRPTHE